MLSRAWPASVGAAALVVAACVSTAGVAGATDTPVPQVGTATATFDTLVDVKALSGTTQIQAPANSDATAPLRKDGTSSASLPSRPSSGTKATPAPTSTEGVSTTDVPNSGDGSTSAARPAFATTPNVVHSNFDGIDQENSDCGCQPSNVNAAVGTTQIAEMVNLRLQVFDKTGVTQCGVGLNTFVGTTDRLGDPGSPTTT